MANSHFFWMDQYVLDGGIYKRSFELSVPAGFESDISDHAAPEAGGSEFAPLICYTTFRNSGEYAVFLASCCPELPPSQSPIFAFCTRTFGNAMQFCNFNLPAGPQFLASFQEYLSYHFPTLATQVSALDFGPSTSRLAIMNGVAHLIQSNAPAITWGS